MRVGGVLHDAPSGWFSRLESWLTTFERNLNELSDLITGNEIFMKRTQGVGYIDAAEATAFSLTGPIARASGVAYDLRAARPYFTYSELGVRTITRPEGDCFARYMVRMEEMRESARLIREALGRLPSGPVSTCIR